MYYYSASPGTAHKYKLLINRCKICDRLGFFWKLYKDHPATYFPYVTKTALTCQCLEFARLLSSRIWEQNISNRSFESCLLWRVNHVQGCSGRWHPHQWQDPEFSYICVSVSPPASTISITLSACIDVSVPKMQRTGEAINKDAQVRHGTQLVLFVFKLFHIFNVRNCMNKSSCLWRLSLTGSWGGWSLSHLP